MVRSSVSVGVGVAMAASSNSSSGTNRMLPSVRTCAHVTLLSAATIGGWQTWRSGESGGAASDGDMVRILMIG